MQVQTADQINQLCVGIGQKAAIRAPPFAGDGLGDYHVGVTQLASRVPMKAASRHRIWRKAQKLSVAIGPIKFVQKERATCLTRREPPLWRRSRVRMSAGRSSRGALPLLRPVATGAN